jgi:membrane-associated phospholipid phosphatase
MAGGRIEPPRRAESTAAVLLPSFALVLLLVRMRWAPGARFDAAVARDARSFAVKHRWLVTLATGVSLFGSVPAIIALSVLLGLGLRRKRRLRAAGFVVSVELLGAALNQLLKLLLARARPVVPDPVATARGASFPSGHAMNSAICYTLIISALLFSGIVRPRRARTALVSALAFYPLLIGLSRVVLGLHFASDVLGGWLLGVGWVALGTAVVRPWRRDPAA